MSSDTAASTSPDDVTADGAAVQSGHRFRRPGRHPGTRRRAHPSARPAAAARSGKASGCSSPTSAAA